MHLIMEQQMVLFYRRVSRSSNVILQTLLCLKQRSVNSLTSLYKIRSLNVSCDMIKLCIWHYNVRNAVDSGRLTLFIVEFLFYHVHCSMFLMFLKAVRLSCTGSYLESEKAQKNHIGPNVSPVWCAPV